MVICLERGADLHIAQLMPLPLTVSCFSKIQIGLPFLVPAHLGCSGKRAVKRVCVCLWSRKCYISTYMSAWQGPQYLVNCCTPVIDVVGRQRLRSATQQLMVVPRHRLSTVGRRAFAVHNPVVWNSLPDDLRARQDYESFRQGLNTWLFSRY